jgi:thioredoxin 1
MKLFMAALVATFAMSTSFAYTDVVGPVQFKTEMKSAKSVLVVLVHAEWCTFCAQQKVILDKLEAKFSDKVTFFRLDVDKNPELSKPPGIPVTIVGKNGIVVAANQGLMSEEELTNLILNALQ